MGSMVRLIGWACPLVSTEIGARVTALEADETLAEAARQSLAGAGVAGVTVEAGPLEAGFARNAPYDAILVNGAVEIRPEGLLPSARRRRELHAPGETADEQRHPADPEEDGHHVGAVAPECGAEHRRQER